MFDLDQAISEWRRQMAAGGVKESDDLNELESHLRDDVEQEVRSGLSHRQAFDAAVQRIGESKALTKEFRKVNSHRAWGLRGNPLTLNVLAVWLIVMGLGYMRTPLILMVNGSGLPLLQMLCAILWILLGLGLQRRNKILRVCAIVWFALGITGNLGHIATHGLSGSVYACAPHIPASGETVRYSVYGFLLVSYPVFYAVQLFNAGMDFFGLFLLTKPSIGKLFRPVSA